ncbi:MAG: glutamine-hydrolyzing GMP synthase [bacterium]
MNNEHEIVILDFGSQYTHLIARRIRELGLVSHIYDNDTPVSQLDNAVGIILSGGPKSVLNQQRLDYDPRLFDLNLPILGMCYGHQLITQHFGGQVVSGKSREYGLAKIKTKPCSLFEQVDSQTQVWMSHGDHVAELPPGFESIAITNNDANTAMANTDKNIYSLQFHPEVTHTTQGKQMLSNFIFNICKAERNWTTNKMLEQIQSEIKQQAGYKNIFLLISGGVDSTVCFALLEKTLGKKRVYGLHIDHGLMRLNESAQVNQALKNIGLDDLHIYNAEKQYLHALDGVADPEQKRKIIGDLFLDIAGQVMVKNGMDDGQWLLGQGTIYPDTVESGGTKQADLIKTHHNRVPRVQEMIAQGKIIEPIRELYKDEVRQIGLKLGLPKNLLYRHPFPGPGLGIRCLCSDGLSLSARRAMQSRLIPVIASVSEASPLLQNQQDCFAYARNDKEKQTLNNKFYKLPIKSVGVQGDERSYAYPALINKLDWEELRVIAPQITNQHQDINRVLVLVSGNPDKIAQSDLKPAYITKQRLELLRQIDHIVNKNILNNPDCSHIWQLPVVMIPFGYNKKETVVLRPVESEEAMTVSWAQISDGILNEIIQEINRLEAVDFIMYDITNKPPGTIEWE